MDIERIASHYNMSHKKRGMAVILNHELFEDNRKNPPRFGTMVDYQRLNETLVKLNFEVSHHKDKCLEYITDLMEKISKIDHTDNDCLLIAIMSHGEMDFISAFDNQYKLDRLCSFFTAERCPSLAGKPKIFFVQACQGDRLDDGIMLHRCPESDGKGVADTVAMGYKLFHADFLIANATIPEFRAWRNERDGSWFMQTLCKELDDCKNTGRDILTMLTFVNQSVSLNKESNTTLKHMTKKKQIACINSTLTRILNF